MTLEQVQSFAEQSKVAITEACKKSRCVDGRYEEIENFPMIAKPGGDAGDIMIAFASLNSMKLELPYEDVLQAVIDSVGGPQNFEFHTDDHAEQDHAGLGMGCGHLKKATLEPDAYGVTDDQMQYITEHLSDLVKQGAHQEVLHGQHAETAVLVVDSDHFGLKPLLRTDDGVQEVFVYEKVMHQHQLDQLARNLQEALANKGVAVEENAIRNELDQAFGQQLNATLQRLAKDLPIYTVKIDEAGNVEVQ